MKPIAHIRTDLPQKFGIPRNSFLTPHLRGRIVFEPEYALESAVSGIESFSHLWLIWQFENGVPGGTAEDIAADSAAPYRNGANARWSPTVRPPRLGGTERVGVFASRSPFRPNPLGLSCVKLDRVERPDAGPVLHVLGADLRDGTPILDIKPYIPFADCHPYARGGWIEDAPGTSLRSTSLTNLENQSRKTSSPASSKCSGKTRGAREASTIPRACTISPTPRTMSPSPSTGTCCTWFA